MFEQVVKTLIHKPCRGNPHKDVFGVAKIVVRGFKCQSSSVSFVAVVNSDLCSDELVNKLNYLHITSRRFKCFRHKTFNVRYF